MPDSLLFEVGIYILSVAFAAGIIYASFQGTTKRNRNRISKLEDGRVAHDKRFDRLDDKFVTRRELELIMRPIEKELHALNETVETIRDAIVSFTPGRRLQRGETPQPPFEG